MDAYKSEWDVLSVATGAGACAVAYILWLDSFTVPMVIDLFNKRFHNYAAMNPGRGEADELHNADFMDILKRGESILEIEPKGNGAKIKGIPVDLSPVQKQRGHHEPAALHVSGLRHHAALRGPDEPGRLPVLPDHRVRHRDVDDQHHRADAGHAGCAGPGWTRTAPRPT